MILKSQREYATLDAMPSYELDARSVLTVKAKSSVHDTTTTWNRISGQVSAAPDTLAAASAVANVDMLAFDAGDWLKNKKLRSDFDLATYPRAEFRLVRVADIVQQGARFSAQAHGELHWRNRTVPLQITGAGELSESEFSAQGTFVFDIRSVGLVAPRFLMFKVADEVEVRVVLHGVVR